MTPAATAVASDVQPLDRPAPRRRHRAAVGAGGADAERFGFQDEVDAPEALGPASEKRLECDIDLESATHFLSRTMILSRTTIHVTDGPGMHRRGKRLFVAVARKAASPVDFRLPHERPITMGRQVPL
jgi:KUP system potassium uptake protein